MNDNAQDLYVWLDPYDTDQVRIGYKLNKAKVAAHNMVTIASTDVDGLAYSIGVSSIQLNKLTTMPHRIKLGIEFVEED